MTATTGRDADRQSPLRVNGPDQKSPLQLRLRPARSDRVPGFGPRRHPIRAESPLGSWARCATIASYTRLGRAMADMTASETRLGTRDFLAYLKDANATNDLAAAMAAIVERRHAVARLEERRAS